jgi:putative ABC transport system permease protein
MDSIIKTGILFGLAPALRTMQVSLIESLKDGARGGAENTLRNRTRSLLVVFESAIAVMLLIGAGLLVRSLIALQQVDPGFEPFPAMYFPTRGSGMSLLTERGRFWL